MMVQLPNYFCGSRSSGGDRTNIYSAEIVPASLKTLRLLDLAAHRRQAHAANAVRELANQKSSPIPRRRKETACQAGRFT
jgi:hypothetical protein